ncbi:glutathione peroxidase-like [Leptopilina heterotoma]|uniref:glutathione peroxidase-like n=1 Tax=Leptopilina heterotoma TaxID=63436 RepID=UPI001CA992A5|nr:glutathione peroxidase-like [Leptopilina heterotoma]
MIRLGFCLVAIAALILQGESDDSKNFNQEKDWKTATSVYDFHAKDIDGNDVSLSKYKDSVLIVVNVATNCTLTDANYEQLQKLYQTYGDAKGLKILAFPCNQFAGQEPGTPQEIKKFVKDRFNVTFDMFDKIEVNQENAHPLWKWMKSQPKGAGTNGTQDIEWNFTKFVINKSGQVVTRFAPRVEPNQMKETLEKLFDEKV